MRNYFLGKIKWYDNLKDYGFLYDIEEENCKSIYFNWKSIVHPYTTSDVLNCLVVRFEKK